jgi:hypothetical protein
VRWVIAHDALHYKEWTSPKKFCFLVHFPGSATEMLRPMWFVGAVPQMASLQEKSEELKEWNPQTGRRPLVQFGVRKSNEPANVARLKCKFAETFLSFASHHLHFQKSNTNFIHHWRFQ